MVKNPCEGEPHMGDSNGLKIYKTIKVKTGRCGDINGLSCQAGTYFLRNPVQQIKYSKLI